MQAKRTTPGPGKQTALLLPGLTSPNGCSRSTLKLLAVAYPAAWLLFMIGLAGLGG